MQAAPTLLLILDGYGVAPASVGNAVSLAHTPLLNKLLALPERINIEASGFAVGLPDKLMGNSEVGHTNLGAGRVVYQDITRIDLAAASGELVQNHTLTDLLNNIKKTCGRLHLMGLLSDGGVHSHMNHIKALIAAAHEHNVPVILHAFMDGRDTSPTSGKDFLAEAETFLEAYGGRLGSFIGRFYAMDRDKRWDRVKVAFDMLVHGQGTPTKSAVRSIEEAYAQGATDEFLPPHLLGQAHDVCVRSGDGVFFFNFRADRARELVSAFHLEEFTAFERGARPHVHLASMTQYEADFTLPVAFIKEPVNNPLGEVVAAAHLRQLRLAETEKYAHVTYFFNGGREDVFAGEDRAIIDSPRDVATYDQKPAMSAQSVAEKLIEALDAGVYSLIVCNFANPDMVGHTGKIDATIKALEAVDACLQPVLAALERAQGNLVLTSDHGNAEEMLDKDNNPHTAHTCNQVPLVVLQKGNPVPLCATLQETSPQTAEKRERVPRLADVAPTILELMHLPCPSDMTGMSLLNKGCGYEQR